MPRISYHGGIDWADIARENMRLKEKEARTRRMRAQAEKSAVATEAARARWRFGPRGIAREELERRYPYGLPEYEAYTGRVTARAYGVATGAAEREVALKEKKFERLKKLEEGGLLGGAKSPEEEIKGIVAKPGAKICPPGYYWNGMECVPTNE